MNVKVKAIIEKHEKDLGDENCTNPNFENMIRDAVKEDVLEEFLDILFQSKVDISADTMTKCLCACYIPNWNSLSAEAREKKVRSITHAINKSQIAIFKAMV